MEIILLLLVHGIAVTALYISAYRTGFAVCETNTRRRAEACVAPLAEMLERLNLDIDAFIEEPDDAGRDTCGRGTPKDHGSGKSTPGPGRDPIGR
jgi:hypothetical protein